MRVQKTFTQPFIQKKTKSSGRLILSKNLWRYDIKSPKPSVVVFNGKSILFCDLKTHIKQKTAASQAPILSIIFNNEDFDKNFKYEQTKTKGRTLVYSFAGKKPSSPQKIAIQIEKDRILSILITWKPPLGEEYYRFSSIEFNKSLDQKIFSHSLIHC